LSKDLHDAFATTGFAYLANAPLSFNHEDVFNLASEFFSLLSTEKMRLAKQTFCDENKNTYRGYFPTQPGQQDNLKEGVRSVPKTPYLNTRSFANASSTWPNLRLAFKPFVRSSA
jgi:isopenicillin N synthase-like dioxygenase